jgi:predicted deacylase
MQIGMIEKAYEGFQNLLIFLNMLPLRAIERPPKPTWVLCSHSRWFYTDVGGILVVHCEIGTWVNPRRFKFLVITEEIGYVYY